MIQKCLKYGSKSAEDEFGIVKFILGDLTVIKADQTSDSVVVTA